MFKNLFKKKTDATPAPTDATKVSESNQESKNVDKNPKGFFAENNGWQHVTQDLIAVIQKAQTDHPNLKHYLLGHSMGSWIALSAVQENIKIDGLVMCGSAKLDNFSILVQSILINFISLAYIPQSVDRAMLIILGAQ